MTKGGMTKEVSGDLLHGPAGAARGAGQAYDCRNLSGRACQIQGQASDIDLAELISPPQRGVRQRNMRRVDDDAQGERGQAVALRRVEYTGAFHIDGHGPSLRKEFLLVPRGCNRARGAGQRPVMNSEAIAGQPLHYRFGEFPVRGEFPSCFMDLCRKHQVPRPERRCQRPRGTETGQAVRTCLCQLLRRLPRPLPAHAGQDQQNLLIEFDGLLRG